MISVFLVEDEIVIREAIRKMIPWADFGYELVGEAKDGEIALPLIKKLKPNLIITDIKMPFMDGLTLSKLVMKELPETKIIIISGHDDFEYARQAINLGVEQYILKPITKTSFIEILQNVREKYDKENAQKNYYLKFQNEIKQYEKHSRRDFFELLVAQEKDLQKLYEKAAQLGLEIMAEYYNLILFTVASNRKYALVEDAYSQNVADIQEIIDKTFQSSTHYILFRNQMFSYAILVKGNQDQIQPITQACIEKLQTIFHQKEGKIEWFACTGEPVERLSCLNQCYEIAMKIFSLRYMGYTKFISYKDYLEMTQPHEEQMRLEHIDVNAINPEIIPNFLRSGLIDEVASFTKNYLQMIGEEALRSNMFRQYIILNVRFATLSFVRQLGYDMASVEEPLKLVYDGKEEFGDLENKIKEVLEKGIQFREENAKGRYKHMLHTALQYMAENFTDDTVTLNKIACVTNVSANHFSAVFSQEMKQTFIEYLTSLRMQKAKELLRCSEMRSGEIALAVGYKDAHYFSFLFKKTQGCTPSAYRHQQVKYHVQGQEVAHE